MWVLVVGASGATGKHLVEQLLQSEHRIKIILRSTSIIPEKWLGEEKLTIIRQNIPDISIEEMSSYLADVQAVASCLGHNLTLKGIFGKPRKLVTNTVQLICDAIVKNTPE
ncbi:MAG: NAD(P)H-binding protein [Cyclobacteriaceae bacterium]